MGIVIILDLFKSIIRRYFGIEVLKHKNFKEALLLSFDNKLNRIMKILVKKNNPVIFDVGANEGGTIDRYRQLFPNGKIYSFEPNNSLYELILKKYSFDKNIFISDLGISNKTQKSKLNIASDHLMSSVEEINYESEFFEKRGIRADETLDINLTTLDSFCEQNDIGTIDILKLNVQGHEPKCLIGANKLIVHNKIKCIIVELDMGNRYGMNNQFYHIEKNLIPHGYTIYDIILIKRNHNNKIQMINAIYTYQDIKSVSN